MSSQSCSTDRSRRTGPADGHSKFSIPSLALHQAATWPNSNAPCIGFADRPGHAHPQPALVDLVGRVPGAPPELPPAHAHPWRHGWSHGWRARCIRRDTPGGAGQAAHPWVGTAVAKPKEAGTGAIEREDIRGRSVAPRLADLAGRPPGRRRVHTCAAAGGPSLNLNRPGGSGTEATTAPQPRIKQVPQGVAEHV